MDANKINKPAKVLLVNDESNLRKTLILILECAGYQVVGVTNETDALHYLDCDHFDLVLVDLNYADSNCVKLSKIIHQNNARLPIIIKTRQAIDDWTFDSNIDSLVSFVLKPIEPPMLLSKIEDVLKAASSI